jgi:hypothetical protein
MQKVVNGTAQVHELSAKFDPEFPNALTVRLAKELFSARQRLSTFPILPIFCLILSGIEIPCTFGSHE